MIKKIIHRPKKPLFVFRREESLLYGPRVKSAPPIEINFETPTRVEPKPAARFTRPDGTPIREEDLIDSTDSDASSESSVEAENKIEDVPPETNANAEIHEEEEVECKEEKPIQKDDRPSLEDRALMLNNLLKRFSEQRITERRGPCYKIDEILNTKERTAIPLELKIRIRRELKGVYRPDSSRKDTCIEQARLEFNRLTAKNIGLVIKNLKSIRVGTIEEMKEVSNILFDKAISEPTFVKYYALVVLDLKKEWQSEEEKSRDVSQTVFFGTLLTLTLKTLENKERWGDEYKKKKDMTFEERIAYEEKLEEAETERYIKKRRTLGTIDFLSSLYSLNVISYVHMNACINTLMKSDDPENIEVLCYLIDNIGEKLVVSGKEHIISMICSSLVQKKSNYTNRIRYMIESLLDKKNSWKSKELKAVNVFSCLEVENDYGNTQDPESQEPHKEDVLPFLASLSEELSMAYEDDDKELLSDNLQSGETKFGVVPFYLSYFQEAISNHKISDLFFDFFISFRNTASITEGQLKEVLLSLKNELEILKIDFPISPKKYAELITKLRVSKIISQSLLEELKTPDYDARIGDLILKWYRSDKDREKALTIFPRETIENLTK
ncbi:transcription initiation factor 4F subunit-like protein [Encephalitozoon intestinalis ATCC 50506]|uniref:Transcription initiation factor 4F subunit-like protein n=1 Tax=Encephalitozoon intestinalis (strain ATCC 50506) TaxID=876142 RepID=E0S6W4_ENCIT|nr:transcription initiation factor 4F subunit-like protein [Encephalitozoon intestinalis ATCC 50506]ADM11449.1 transcription initiation factor 4F subunit-like protein [Encephalitozoon intestinalis ATCC 50506]UTX45146.1 putative eukaryotic translation initiation factor 4 gamma [Encephalitozoon intestinalis]